MSNSLDVLCQLEKRMSIDISRVARAVCDLSVGSKFPLKLSHAQQCVAAAFGFNSLAAYQAAKKLEVAVAANEAFLILENDLIAGRVRDLDESLDAVEVAAVIRQAVMQRYPGTSIHSAWELRRVSVASAISGLIGVDAISGRDLDDVRYQVVENRRGDVQGFMFNFDEPDWAAFAPQVQARHGALCVYAPASFLRVVQGCEEPERYYFHGDQVEGSPKEFFCGSCDAFVDSGHLNGAQHADNGKRYLDSVRKWDRAVARWKLGFQRSNTAPNILATRASNERRIAEAARSDFHRWIEQQTDRDGAIGDLAKDIMRDTSFPMEAATRADVVSYIEDAATWDGPVTGIKEAWDEFVSSYEGKALLSNGSAPSWPIGPAAINAISMPPDHRAILVPQLVLLDVPGRVYWRFSDGDETEASSKEHLATLEEALDSAGASLARVQWVDVTYQGVVMGSCHGWELKTYANKIAGDLKAGAEGTRS